MFVEIGFDNRGLPVECNSILPVFWVLKVGAMLAQCFMGTFVFEIPDAIRKRLKSILSSVLYLANARTRHKQGVGYQVAICETGTGKGPAATAHLSSAPPL